MRWFSVRAVRTEWEGRPGSLNFLTDITESKGLRDNLAQTLAEQEAILQTSMVGIAFSSTAASTGSTRRSNSRCWAMARASSSGSPSVVTYALPEDYERVTRECYPLLAAGESFATELQMKRKRRIDILVLAVGQGDRSDEPRRRARSGCCPTSRCADSSKKSCRRP